MALVRRVPQEDRAMRAGKWQTPPLGIDMAGKTLGVIGLGKIGGKMAGFGRLLGMRVLASGITLTDERAAGASPAPRSTSSTSSRCRRVILCWRSTTSC